MTNFSKNYKMRYGKSKIRRSQFRTLYNKTYYRLFAFWDKEDKDEKVVISSHGFIKKTDKTPKSEIEKAERLRKQYFNEKKKKK